MEAPELLPGLEFAFNAFFELNGDRQSGFGVGRIPWHVLDAYGRRHGLADDELEDFTHHLQEMDSEFLAYNEEQRAARKG